MLVHSPDFHLRSVLRSRIAHRVLIGSAIASMLVGCAGAGETHPPPAPERPFHEVFETLGSTSVVASGPEVLARVSEFATDGANRFFIADGSEGNVKVIGADGRMQRIIGRKGGGPGEFARPSVTRFDSIGGALHVLDVMTGRIQVFDDTGALLRITRPRRMGPITSLDVLAGGQYLVAQEFAGEPAVLHAIDTTGQVRSNYLPIGGRFPSNVPRRSDWNSLRSHYFARRGDSLFVISALSDSLWIVDRQTERILHAEAIPVPRYQPPQDLPLRSGLRGPNLVMAWARSFHRASRIVASDHSVFVAFTKGAIFQGDSTVLMMRDAAGSWHSLSGAPVILGASHDRLYGTADIGADTLRISTFVPRER